jgi:hypothetical protein
MQMPYIGYSKSVFMVPRYFQSQSEVSNSSYLINNIFPKLTVKSLLTLMTVAGQLARFVVVVVVVEVGSESELTDFSLLMVGVVMVVELVTFGFLGEGRPRPRPLVGSLRFDPNPSSEFSSSVELASNIGARDLGKFLSRLDVRLPPEFCKIQFN